MKKLTKIPENLINTTVKAEVTCVQYNKYSHLAKIDIIINIDENSELKLSDEIFVYSKYSLNEKKYEVYDELFGANSSCVKDFCKNICTFVDFYKYSYNLTVKLCISKRNTHYFEIEDFERVELLEDNDAEKLCEADSVPIKSDDNTNDEANIANSATT